MLYCFYLFLGDRRHPFKITIQYKYIGFINYFKQEMNGGIALAIAIRDVDVSCLQREMLV